MWGVGSRSSFVGAKVRVSFQHSGTVGKTATSRPVTKRGSSLTKSGVSWPVVASGRGSGSQLCICPVKKTNNKSVKCDCKEEAWAWSLGFLGFPSPVSVVTGVPGSRLGVAGPPSRAPFLRGEGEPRL